MKRLGTVLLSVILLLACSVPVGAYQWSGESFLQDYFEGQVNPLLYEPDFGHFEFLGSSPIIEGSSVNVSYDVDPIAVSSSNIVRYRSSIFDVSSVGDNFVSGTLSGATFRFVFDEPQTDFSLSGSCYFQSSFYRSRAGSSARPSSGFNGYPSWDISIGGQVVRSFPSSDSSVRYDVTYLYSGDAVSSFSITSSALPFIQRSSVFGSNAIVQYVLYGSFSIDIDPDPDPPTPTAYTITFDPNGGTGGGTLTTGTDGKLTSLPSAPVRDGYTFDGWYTAASGGVQVMTSTVFSADTTVYAHWTENAGPDPPDPVDPDPPDPVVPGEGDFKYTEVAGEELAQEVKLSSSATTGGAMVFWEYDSYETGNPSYPVTVPGGSEIGRAHV